MFKEFKEFAIKGNALDLAIGVIIGLAFGKIVTSLVSDIVMPTVGLLLGNMDFSNLFIDLSGGNYNTIASAKAAGAPTLNYGLFINSIIDFVIIAFAIFLATKPLNRLKKAPPPDPTKRECPECVAIIPTRAKRCQYCTSLVNPT